MKTLTINVENDVYWVDTGHAEEGPFDTILEASEFVLQFITSRAKLFEPRVYFLEARSA